jgi:serine/threonine protein kinase
MYPAAGSRLGPYEILGPIGAGGMGEVYKAKDTRLGREVAIKVLPADRLADEGRRRRFVQEAQAASVYWAISATGGSVRRAAILLVNGAGRV